MRKTGIFVVLLLLLVGINLSIWRTEQVLADGKEVILQLAPRDPRSLMQGDYMALNFAMGNEIMALLREQQKKPANGRVIVENDSRGVARLVALDDGRALAENQLQLQYRYREQRIRFATNAFFFQEGTGAQYETARYGRFRVSEDGQPYLTDLLDENLERIGTTRLLEH